MTDREELQETLESVLETKNVYFQPPSSVEMSYPAIKYCRSKIENVYANNTVYQQHNRYELTVIDPNPDSEIARKVSLLPMCTHNRHYVADNLHHDVFTLYYSRR